MEKTATKPKKLKKKRNKSRLIEILRVLRRNKMHYGITPEKLRKTLEDLGPTFIKIGQILSTRLDLFSLEYCAELTKLCTEVPAMNEEDIREIIISNYGKQVDEIFSEFDFTPIGSASIAQVHRGVLKDGTVLVLKIERNGIFELMERDINFLKKASKLLRLTPINKVVDFNMILDELWETAQQEMDFEIEKEHITKMAELNKDIKYIDFPNLYLPLCTKTVLAMECITGYRLDDISSLKNDEYDLVEIGEKLVENYVKQVIDDGFFHADPHIGNILVRDGKIIWLDLGMVGELSKSDKDSFAKAAIYITEKNISDLVEVILSIADYDDKINYVTLYEDVDHFVTKYVNISLNKIKVQELTIDLFEICADHGLRLPKGITMLFRGIVVIEGVITLLSPETNFMKILTNHISRNFIHNYDLKKESLMQLKNIGVAGKKAIDVPIFLADLLKKGTKGQAKINVELVGSEEPLKHFDVMIDKLLVAILIASIVVASSILCAYQVKPLIFGISLFGILGFLLGAVLGFSLAFYIIFRQRRRRHRK